MTLSTQGLLWIPGTVITDIIDIINIADSTDTTDTTDITETNDTIENTALQLPCPSYNRKDKCCPAPLFLLCHAQGTLLDYETVWTGDLKYTTKTIAFSLGRFGLVVAMFMCGMSPSPCDFFQGLSFFVFFFA